MFYIDKVLVRHIYEDGQSIVPLVIVQVLLTRKALKLFDLFLCRLSRICYSYSNLGAHDYLFVVVRPIIFFFSILALNGPLIGAYFFFCFHYVNKNLN